MMSSCPVIVPSKGRLGLNLMSNLHVQNSSEAPLRQPPLKRHPPFTGFAVDVDDLKQLSGQSAEEMLPGFSKVKHIARFSRPLWSAYDRSEHIARLKLIGSSKDAKYDPRIETICWLCFRSISVWMWTWWVLLPTHSLTLLCIRICELSRKWFPPQEFFTPGHLLSLF